MLKNKTKEELIKIIENMPSVDNTKSINNLIYDIEQNIFYQESRITNLKILVSKLANCNNKNEVLEAFDNYSYSCCQDTFCQITSAILVNYLEHEWIK